MTVIFIVLTRSFYFAILADSYMLLLASSLFLKDIKKILSITFVVLCFSSIVLLPSAFFGNGKNSLLICLKIIGTVMSLNILSYTTKSRNITKSLKFFFVPDIFILIMDMTIKYIVILGNFSINMLYSLKIRSVGRDKSKHTSLSGLIGTLFLKSKEMAEETFYAMECRGFSGDYRSKMDFKIHLIDVAYIIVNLIVISFFFLISKG
jgi:cobalt/nickel transport system permease protein